MGIKIIRMDVMLVVLFKMVGLVLVSLERYRYVVRNLSRLMFVVILILSLQWSNVIMEGNLDAGTALFNLNGAVSQFLANLQYAIQMSRSQNAETHNTIHKVSNSAMMATSKTETVVIIYARSREIGYAQII